MGSLDHDQDVGRYDLSDEIASALDPEKLTFNGYYYYAAPQATAPNPCLKINGLGVIGLPLSQRDVAAMTSYASAENIHHMVVEGAMSIIEAEKVAFMNPLWDSWVKQSCNTLCAKLGLHAGSGTDSGTDTEDESDAEDESNTEDQSEAGSGMDTQDTEIPQMRLRELRLLGTGCSSSSYKSNQNVEGTIGTVVVILPSEYLGGETEYSYLSTTRTLDFSAHSLLGTIVLASYKEVKSRVLPITSGHQLALVYDLVSPAMDFVHPSLPDPRGMLTELESVFQNWRKAACGSPETAWYKVYLLQKHYGKEALKNGEMCLEGVDRQRVAIVRDAAVKYRFKALLATVEQMQYGWYHNEEGEFKSSWHEKTIKSSKSNFPTMASDYCDVDPELEALNITGFVDLDGKSLPDLERMVVKDKDSIIPSNPFIDVTLPTSYVFERNGPGTTSLEYFYRRTVLILMPEEHADAFYWSVGGMNYAMKQLSNRCTPPSPEDKVWVARILKDLARGTSRYHWESEHAQELMNMALGWRDVHMWKELMKYEIYKLNALKIEDLDRIRKQLGVEALQESLEIIFRSSKISTEQDLDLLYRVPQYISTEDAPMILPWCQAKSNQILSSLPLSFPTILEAILKAGYEAFKQLVCPRVLAQPSDFTLHFGLAQALRTNRQSIRERQAEILARPPFKVLPPLSGSEPKEPEASEPDLMACEADMDRVAEHCLQQAALQWFIPSTEDSEHAQYAYPIRKTQFSPIPLQKMLKKDIKTVNRIIEILAEATTSGRKEICQTLFNDILKSPGSSEVKYATIYSPLVPRLVKWLHDENRDISSSPFVDFLQVVIATYLRDILGSKSELRNRLLRKVGCGCKECGPLDTFMLDLSRGEHTFRIAQRGRDHLAKLLEQATDLCTFRTIKSGTPHGLQVTKLPEVTRLSTWEYRAKEANAFLRKIGSDDIIAKIMGVRYQAVKEALSGDRPFAPSDHNPITSAPEADDALSSSSAGKKRKRIDVDSL